MTHRLFIFGGLGELSQLSPADQKASSQALSIRNQCQLVFENLVSVLLTNPFCQERKTAKHPDCFPSSQ